MLGDMAFINFQKGQNTTMRSNNIRFEWKKIQDSLMKPKE